MKKAWRAIYGGMHAIYATETRGQAASKTLRTIREIWDRKANYKDIRVVREPAYDRWAELDATGVGWDEKLLPKN